MYSFDQLFDQIIGPALGETLYMTFLAVIFSLILGFIMSILLILSHEEGLRLHALLYSILDIVINICRSLPFIILAVSITPFYPLSGGDIGRAYSSGCSFGSGWRTHVGSFI